jgi:hypothetical protein
MSGVFAKFTCGNVAVLPYASTRKGVRSLIDVNSLPIEKKKKALSAAVRVTNHE